MKTRYYNIQILCQRIFILMLVILCSGLTPLTIQAANLSKALPRSIVITEGRNRTSYKVKSVPEITLNGAAISSDYPLMKLGQVWMAPGEQFFRDKLGFGYQYNETDHTVTLKNPALDVTFLFTMDSNSAKMNGANISLDHAVVWAKDVETGEKTVLLPLVNVIEKSKLSIQVTKNTINIKNDLPYHAVALPKEELDQQKYNNAIDGICIQKGKAAGERSLYVDTLKNLSNADVSYHNKETGSNAATELQIVFPKTRNLLGDFMQTFSEGAISKITVKEDEQYNTVITVEYKIKFIYSKKFSGTHVITTFSVADYDLRIALPSGVKFSSITASDQYWKKRFLIIVPGNHVSYYKKNVPVKNNSVIKSVKVSKTAEGNTKITVTTTKLQGYRLKAGTGFFSVDIGSPKSIYKNIVMLDAGHGGKDRGAVKNGLKEKTLNYNIIYTKAKKYFESQDSNVKAYWTRHDDTLINLYKRPKYSAAYDADLFISLHMNSAPNSAANGTEVYYSRNNNKKNRAGLTSKILAQRMYSTLINDMGTRRRGVKQAGFVVIKNNTVPSVLIELGFVSGSRDSKNLRKSSYQTRAAKSIYRGVSNVFKSYPTKR